jgi:hypothetical protein
VFVVKRQKGRIYFAMAEASPGSASALIRQYPAHIELFVSSIK